MKDRFPESKEVSELVNAPQIHRQLYHVATNGHWHQFSANSNLQFGVWWRRKLFSADSSIVIQHSCEAALGWGGPEMRSLSSESSALPLSVPPAVLHSGLTIYPQCFMFSILAPFLKTVFSLPWKEKVHPTPPLSQRRATYIPEVPAPGHWLGLSSYKWRL